MNELLSNEGNVLGRAPYGARGLKCQRQQRAFRRGGRAPYGARGLKSRGGTSALKNSMGRAPYGARGLKSFYFSYRKKLESRAPYGARGLKSTDDDGVDYAMGESRPVWGAWIEIMTLLEVLHEQQSRAPYGARGLKFIAVGGLIILWESRPVWGAWIEIQSQAGCRGLVARSRPVWGAWIEMGRTLPIRFLAACRAPYGARGLKFILPIALTISLHVAPRMGRVD